jgi:hypothetical protein
VARHPALDPPEVEGPAAPIICIRVEKEGLGPPAGHGRGRAAVGAAEAEQQPGRPAGLGGELEAAAGQKIEGLELQHDTRHRRRTQRLVRRPQDLPLPPAVDEEQPCGVDAEPRQAGTVEPPLPPDEGRVRAPDESTRMVEEAAGEEGREAGGEAAPHLVQRAERQPAPGQGGVDHGLAQGRHRHGEAGSAAGEAADPGAQLGKGRRVGQGSPVLLNVLLMFYIAPGQRQASCARAFFAPTG